MTAHKHAAMIKAKADNMDLVVFVRSGSRWLECRRFPEWCQSEYFLCLPQHKDICLHWLNGGDIEYKNELAPRGWGSVSSIKESIEEDMEDGEELWSERVYFMRNDVPIRIKPRKEKRWIAVNNSGYATPMTFISKQECESYVSVSYQKSPILVWQFIEIEVEV